MDIGGSQFGVSGVDSGMDIGGYCFSTMPELCFSLIYYCLLFQWHMSQSLLVAHKF